MTTDAAATASVDRRRVAAAVAAIEAGGERVRRRQVDRAVDALEARGDLTDGQRAAVEDLGEAVVDALLGPPAATLRAAAAEGDRATVEAVLRVFGPGGGAAEGVSGDE